MVKLHQSLKPLLSNPSWVKMEEYLAGEKSRLVTQLCNCNEQELKKLQGQIAMLDQLAGLKKTLLAEEGRIS